jgi:hypothetical protein
VGEIHRREEKGRADAGVHYARGRAVEVGRGRGGVKNCKRDGLQIFEAKSGRRPENGLDISSFYNESFLFGN